MKKNCCTAIVLAAGQGSRMKSEVQKQYLLLGDKPVLYYSLKAFQESSVIDYIYLVVGAGEEESCREKIVSRYGMTKVTKILEGGNQRCESVWSGLSELEGEGYVFIHDGARPLINGDIIRRVFEEVRIHKACVVGMPVKDTIKIAGKNGYVEHTPDRNRLWLIQTPQVFENQLVKHAYSMFIGEPCIQVTDDAMVVEQVSGHTIKLVEGSYDNIKITTPEDLEIAQVLLNRRQKM